MRKRKIRVIVLGLVRHGDRVLLSEGYDSKLGSHYYRALGGGIDFGESSQDALRREFQEELRVELENIRYLGCSENLFCLEDEPGHEIVFAYQCDLCDRSLYEKSSIPYYEGHKEYQASWIEISELQSGIKRLVPEVFLSYL
ncbi:MAG: NUDIX domain-containing protein [Synechococcales bacterium]|nr:NUDIX domain-containing protein [Synechococcales bacterium]